MEVFGCFPEEEESDDEWFFQSIKKYEDLLMYDVQGEVSCMCFCDENTLLLAVSRDAVQEVWQVRVPEKLVAGRNTGLVKDRDFTLVAAGYTTNILRQVLWTRGGAATSGPGGVHLYSRDESDVMSLTSTLRTDVQDASLAATDSVVYSGETLSNLASTNFTSNITRKLVIQPKEGIDTQNISKMSIVHENMFLGLREMGRGLVYDMKAGNVVQIVDVSEMCSGRWSMDVSQDGNTMALAASTGALSFHDLRNPSQPVFTIMPETQADPFTKPEVHISPTGSQLSLSGSGKFIRVIDCKRGEGKNEPVFVHDGHRSHGAKRVVSHLWHLTEEQLLFSADDNSKVQAWRFR